MNEMNLGISDMTALDKEKLIRPLTHLLHVFFDVPMSKVGLYNPMGGSIGIPQ